MELFKARVTGKVTKEVLDFELAKATSQISEEYRPRVEPSKPFEMRKFEGMKEGELEDMEDWKAKKLESKYWGERKSWREECDSVKAMNASNLIWLRMCLDRLKGRPEQEKIMSVIYDHENMKIGAA
jgi:hypothetical protein